MNVSSTVRKIAKIIIVIRTQENAINVIKDLLGKDASLNVLKIVKITLVNQVEDVPLDARIMIIGVLIVQKDVINNIV